MNMGILTRYTLVEMAASPARWGGAPARSYRDRKATIHERVMDEASPIMRSLDGLWCDGLRIRRLAVVARACGKKIISAKVPNPIPWVRAVYEMPVRI